MEILDDMLVGKTTNHLIPFENQNSLIHYEIQTALIELKNAAYQAGFHLAIASSFRSFDSQLKIWNEKVSGGRPILDENGNVLDKKKLSSLETMYAILRWSALPGLSRHHWGTDLDIFDKNALKEGEIVKLIPEEVSKGGKFGPFHHWLDIHLKQYEFFRPFSLDQGGVLPERWHISYYPVAKKCFALHSKDLIEQVIQINNLELKEIVLENLDDIFSRFFLNISSP